MQRPVEIVARCRCRRPAPPRSRPSPRPARPACRPCAARGRNRRCCRRAGRRRSPRSAVERPSSIAIATPPPASSALTSSRMRRPSPCSMRAMSSWYFSSTPIVSETVSGSSATLSSSVSALAQSMRLGDARHLEQVDLRAASGRSATTSADSRWLALRHLAAHDLQLARGVGIVDPVIEAAPLQRVVDLARAVGGDDDDRRLLGLDRAELGHRHLEVGQDLQQEGLERLVGAVELVDQEDRRAPALPVSACSTGRRIRYRSEKTFVSMSRAVDRRRPPPPCGSRSSARHSSTRRPPRRRRGPRSIAAGSAGGRARCASTLAISVLPTPASPSRNSGRLMRSARNSTVASARSAT